MEHRQSYNTSSCESGNDKDMCNFVVCPSLNIMPTSFGQNGILSSFVLMSFVSLVLLVLTLAQLVHGALVSDPHHH